MEHAEVLRALGFAERDLTGGSLTVVSPIDGALRLRRLPKHRLPTWQV